MLGIMNNCIAMYQRYFQNSPYLVLFLCAILYIFLDHNKQVKKVFLGHTVLFMVIYWCPVTAYIIANYCVGTNVYWRMFWMLPVTITIAYVLTKLFDHADGFPKKAVLFVGIVMILTGCGYRIYNSFNFQEAANLYKLNPAVVQACDVIREHASANGVENIGVLAADPFVTELREYDAGIRMPYGRDMLRGQNKKKTAQKIYACINAQEPEPKTLKKYAKKGNYAYLIYSQAFEQEVFEKVGYEWIGESYGYSIYYVELD